MALLADIDCLRSREPCRTPRPEELRLLENDWFLGVMGGRALGSRWGEDAFEDVGVTRREVDVELLRPTAEVERSLLGVEGRFGLTLREVVSGLWKRSIGEVAE